MRILHVITTINRGGAENHLASLVSRQVAMGLKVTVAYLKGDGYWTSAMRAAGVRVESLGLERYGELAPLFRLRALIKSVAPDIVHAHMPPAELYARLALLLLRKPPVFLISKHNDERFFSGLGQGLVGRWVSHRAARVIAISGAVSRYTRRALGVEDWRVSTIHYGIDPEPYERVDEQCSRSVRAEWGVPEGAWVIGTVARLVPQKALHVLLRAFAQYREMAGRDSRLVLVGRGPLEEELKSLACELGLQDAIVWAGFREDIPQVMKAFDTFALTSSYEGFGLVLLEAMAAGRPVVASAVSAIPEIVQPDVTGILCGPEDVDAFARALLRLEQDELRSRLGGAGHARAVTQFALGRMADATSSIYKESLDGTATILGRQRGEDPCDRRNSGKGQPGG